jgi:hypothetical protein
MSNEPDLSTLSLDVRRAIANAKMAEFENQAYRIGDIVSTRLLCRAAAGDVLLDAAVANGLVAEHGDDTIQAIIAEGLDCGAHQ